MSVSARMAMFQNEGKVAPQRPQAPANPIGRGAAVSVHTLSLDDNTKRPRAVSCLAVNGDGTLFAYSPNNHEVHVAEYTGSGFNTISVLKEHGQLVTSMDWAHNSDRIVTCSQDRNAYVWVGDRAMGWKPTLVHLRIHRAATYVKWCNSENKFAVASGQKSVAVCYYEVENNWWVSKLIEGFESTVLTVAWHKSDMLLAAGSSDGTVRLFTAFVKGIDSKPNRIFGPDVSFNKMGTEICTIRANAWVHDMNFSPSSDVLAFATHDSCVSFLPIVEGSPPSQESVVRVKCSGLPHQRVLFITNDRLLAGGHDCNPSVFVRKGAQWVEGMKIDDESTGKNNAGVTSVRSAAFSKFQAAIMQGTFSHGNNNAATSFTTAHQNCITDLVTCQAWGGAAKATKVASAGLDGRLCLWDLTTMDEMDVGPPEVQDLEATQRECADWHPAPVLLGKGDPVTMRPAGDMQHREKAFVVPDVDLPNKVQFKVFLNEDITQELSPEDLEVMQREFADWHPGPVLLRKGDPVIMRPAGDKQHQGKAFVVQHARDDPRAVTVRREGCATSIWRSNKGAPSSGTLLQNGFHKFIVHVESDAVGSNTRRVGFWDIEGADTWHCCVDVSSGSIFINGNSSKKLRPLKTSDNLVFELRLDSHPTTCALYLEGTGEQMHLIEWPRNKCPVVFKFTSAAAPGTLKAKILKELEVSYQMLTPDHSEDDQKEFESMKGQACHERLQMMLFPDVPFLGTLIGYNEFRCRGNTEHEHLEREYWFSFRPLPFIQPAQVPLHTSLSDHDLCVVHVKYVGGHPNPSQVSHVSLRLTQTVELRAHQNKCKICDRCENRRHCSTCKKCNKRFERFCKIKARCSSHGCATCRTAEKNADERFCKFKGRCDRCETCEGCSIDHTTCDSCTDLRVNIDDKIPSGCAKCFMPDMALDPECIKCNVKICAECIACQECVKCLDTKRFKRCGNCQSEGHRDCKYCPDFKWSALYGKQFLKDNEMLGALQWIASMTSKCTETFDFDLEDLEQRRFAFVVGNDAYDTYSTGYNTLDNCIIDAKLIADAVAHIDLSFKVHTGAAIKDTTKTELEREIRDWTRTLPDNAVACIFFSGHGVEVGHSERFFVPVSFAKVRGDYDSDLKIAQKECVSLKWILGLVNRTLGHDGLIISVWNCCREGAKNQVLRSHESVAPLIRGLDAFDLELNQLSSPDRPAQVCLCASLPGCMAFDGKVGGSPFTQALISWWKNPNLSHLQILDPEVSSHVQREVTSLTPAGAQCPEWTHSGSVNFCFLKKFTPPPNSLFIPTLESGPQQSEANKIGKEKKEGEKELWENCSEGLGCEPNNWHWKDRVEWPQLPSPGTQRICEQHPLKVLFVGANSPGLPKLSLKKEVENMEKAFYEEGKHTSRGWGGRRMVYFEHVMIAEASELSEHLIQINPTILHFACHSDRSSALKLFRTDKTLESLQNLLDISDCDTDSHLQLVIANACNSHEICNVLCQKSNVDFVIGHKGEVSDKSALIFAESLYRGLGGKMSLLESFRKARGADQENNAYCLVGRKHAGQFKFEPLSKCAPSNEKESLMNCNRTEIITFLESEGLGIIAPRICEKLQIHRKQDLAIVTQNDVYTLEFLLEWQTTRLLRVVESVIAAALSCASEASTDREDESTGSENEDNENEFVAVMHPGDLVHFKKHMQDFVQEFMRELFIIDLLDGDMEEEIEWTCCMLIWLRFAQDTPLSRSTRDEWLGTCQQRFRRQEKMMICLDTCLLKHEFGNNKWDFAEFERLDCSKPHAASVFITDKIVQLNLKEHEESVQKWKRDVMQGWFENAEEDASAFLKRANTFLREHVVNGVRIVETPIKTNSYVAFMVMSRLASMILFEYLKVRRSKHFEALQNPDPALNSYRAQVELPNLFQGFQLFVSSTRRVFSVTPSSLPALDLMPTIFQGLECLSRLSASALETLGPVKTISELIQETQNDLEDRREIAAQTKLDESEEAEDADCAHGESFEANAQRMQISSVWENDPKRNLIKIYLKKIKNEVNFYVDSASGENLLVDGGSIPLLLSSFEDSSNEDNAIPRDLVCPVSRYIMHDCVKCSDGKTYERDNIEKWSQQTVEKQEIHSLWGRPSYKQARPDAPFGGLSQASTVTVLSPLTEANLLLDAESDVPKLCCESNEEMLAKIQSFRQEKQQENVRRKKEVEGVDERRIMCSRYGYRLQDPAHKDKRLRMDSTDKLFTEMVMMHSRVCCVCITGPPASGKTVTMFRFVHAAVNDCKSKIQNRQYPLLPLFMRAAELSRLLLKQESRIQNLQELMCLFLSAHYPQKVVDVITTLFDLNQLLICIDGLDEATLHQELIESFLDEAVEMASTSLAPLRILLSMREHSYVHSRNCLRLGQFDEVKLQPLNNEAQRDNMIKQRISNDKIDRFTEQLAVTARQNPELSTSPFLLSLILEVYTKHDDEIPMQRVKLYAQQVKVVVSKCIQKRINEGFRYEDLSFGKFTGDSAAVSLAIEFLEALAFSCQMQLETRDFTVGTSSGLDGWEHSSDLYGRIRELLFQTPGEVGLVTCVGGDIYRFNHLTLQEYLAARCSIRLCGNSPDQLRDLFIGGQRRVEFSDILPVHVEATKNKDLESEKMLPKPEQSAAAAFLPMLESQPVPAEHASMKLSASRLHSVWRKEVLQFAACMLSTASSFVHFCGLLLADEDGVGVHCEIVQDFLKERGDSENVEQLVRDKMREIRSDKLLTGLCHPSLELRTLFLSEMQQFCMPEDPFADKTVAKLMERAEDLSWEWHRRVAAIFSITHIAKMEYAPFYVDGRASVVKWMLTQLQSDANLSVDENSALVVGLGILFKHSDLNAMAEDSMNLAETKLSSSDDALLLAVIDHDQSMGLLAEAIADVEIVSDGLIDWLLGNPAVISRGTWPMRHLCLICKQLAGSSDSRNSMRLAEALIRRLHALSFTEDDRNFLLESLPHLYAILPPHEGPTQALDRLRFGFACQRVRVLDVAENLSMIFTGKSADQLAQSLFFEVLEVAPPAKGLSKASLYSPPSPRYTGRATSDLLLSLPVVESVFLAGYLAASVPIILNPFGFPFPAESFEEFYVGTSLLAYIFRERPEMSRLLLDILRGSGDSLTPGSARESVVSGLMIFEKIKSEEKQFFTTFDPLASLLHDMITQIEREVEIQKIARCQSVKHTSLLFNLFPSVVSWNSQNWNKILAPQLIVENARLTLHSLEEMLVKTSTRSSLSEVFHNEGVAPKLRFVCAKLWERSGLTNTNFISDLIQMLGLTEAQIMDFEDLFKALESLEDPWIPRFRSGNYRAHLLEDFKTADVTFSVSDQHFPAHWFVLADRNEYFRDLLLEEMDGKPILLSKVSPGAFKVLLRFVYTRVLPEREDCGEGLDVGEMVQVASRFKEAGMYEHCQRLFMQELASSNAIKRLVRARACGLIEMEEAVLDYLSLNTQMFQREAMKTLDCPDLQANPDLLDKVTNALQSGLTQEGGSSGGGRAVLDAGPAICESDNGIWADKFWARQVCNAMRFDMLGRFMFTCVLKHIRQRFESNIATASMELQPLAVEIQRWKPKNKDQELERQLLLKELCIGRREMQMPTWLGRVSGRVQEPPAGGRRSDKK